MSMNIKSEEAHRLAREIAAMTHQSVTAAVTEALREKRARLADERAERLRKILAITEAIAPYKGDATSSMDEFYDPDTGLPL
jgi:antitoxin VapB